MIKSRVFWFAPINVTAFEKRVPCKLFVGAASRKVMNLLAALRSTGTSAVAVAMPLVGKGWRGKWLGAEFVRDKAPVLRLCTTSYPWFNRFLATFGYLWVVIRWVRRSDFVVLYNFYPEYIPACIFLRIFKKAAILEVEDFPVFRLNFRELIGFASFRLVRLLCAVEVMAVSQDVADKVQSERACVIQGVVSDDDTGRQDSLPQFEQGLRVLFGGTLVRDTGSELFVDAVLWLRENARQVQIEFVVTGIGDLEAILALQEGNEPTGIKVDVQTNLTPSEYRAALKSCHASLCLKNPGSNLGTTTFPSKVIEIAGNGLLLISTRVSDVPEIFEGAALFIDDFSGETLGRALLWSFDNEAELRRLAELGLHRVQERFSFAAVSSKLKDLFLER